MKKYKNKYFDVMKKEKRIKQKTFYHIDFERLTAMCDLPRQIQ